MKMVKPRKYCRYRTGPCGILSKKASSLSECFQVFGEDEDDYVSEEDGDEPQPDYSDADQASLDMRALLDEHILGIERRWNDKQYAHAPKRIVSRCPG